MEASVVYNQDIEFKPAGEGVRRKILAYNEQLMMVEVHFEQGAEGSVHTHPHLQSTYVLSGAFRFSIAGKDVEVRQGDTIAFPGGIPHGTLCLEAGVLMDVFTPMRKDFVG